MRILPLLLLAAPLAAAAPAASPHQKRIYVPAAASADLRARAQRPSIDELMDYAVNRSIPPARERRDAYRGEYTAGPAGGGGKSRSKRAMPPGAGMHRTLSHQDMIDLHLGKEVDRRPKRNSDDKADDEPNEAPADAPTNESVESVPSKKRALADREEDENGYPVDEPVGGLDPPKAKRALTEREEDENGYPVDEPVGGLDPPKAAA